MCKEKNSIDGGKEKGKWVSDIIENRYVDWVEYAKNYFVFLKAGCGSGKTRFMFFIFLIYAILKGLKIRIFVPRKSLREKAVGDLLKLMEKENLAYEIVRKHVFVMTYQELEQRRKKGLEIPHADICIVEEASYFYDDASFNTDTQISYDWLTGEGKGRLNIWISGTGERIFERVKGDLLLKERVNINKSSPESMPVKVLLGYKDTYEEIDTERDYSWLDVYYLPEDFKVTDLVRLAPREKWLFFYDNKANQLEAYEELKAVGYSVAYLNSENFEESPDLVQSISSLDKFSQQILLTTAVIESGNDLTELQLKNVVLLCASENRFIQMASRRRRQKADDKVKLYIPKRSQGYFEWCLENVSDRLKIFANDIYQKPVEMSDVLLAMKEKRDIEGILGFFCMDNGEMKFSDLLVEELVFQQRFYKKMCAALQEDEHAFIKEQLHWLGLEVQFDTTRYISNAVAEDAKCEILDKVKQFAEESDGYTHDEASNLVKSLAPLVEKVDRSVTKGGMALPKFKKFCEDYRIACQCSQVSIKGRNRYYFEVFETEESYASTEEGVSDEG